MRAEDEFELLKTLFLSSEVMFNHERHRIQLALIMQLAGITGNRPAALLAICYRHVKVTLLPDPNGGERPRVILEIVYKYTKGYLGQKEAFVLSVASHTSYDNGSVWSLTSVIGTSLASPMCQMSHVYCFVPISQCWH